MRLTMLALLPLLASQPAFAESWRLAAYSNNAPQLAYLVDIDSVQRSGSTVTFRQQTVYERTTDTRDFDRTMTTRQADCGSNTSFMRDSSLSGYRSRPLGHDDRAVGIGPAADGRHGLRPLRLFLARPPDARKLGARKISDGLLNDP